jgi:hypothetical protein
MAIKAFNSVGGFSVGENAANVILANGDITTSNANLSANLFVTDTANVGNLRTNNLLYANGQPWDLQEAAGANNQIQYNEGNNFAASSNFTFDPATSLLTIVGNVLANNANLGNLAIANFFTGTLTTNAQSNITSVGNLTSLNVDGITNLANILNVNANIEANFNINADGNIDGANLNTLGLANIGNLQISGNVTGNLIPSANVTYNLGNTTNRWKDLYLSGSTIIIGDQSISANAGGLSLSNITYLSSLEVTGNANIGLTLTGNAANFSGNVIAPNVTVNLELSGNTANFSGNVIAPNVTVNLALSGNTANFSGNVIAPNVTVNLELSGNTANFSGNVIAANLQSNALTNTYVTFAGTGGVLTNSANITYNDSTQLLTVIGNSQFNNANLGNLATANFVNVASNVFVTDTANVGNLRTNNLLYANGQPWDLQEAAGANTQIQFNDGNNNFGASANFAFNDGTQLLTVTGSANISNVANVGNLIVTGTSNLGNVGNVTITGGSNGYYLQTNGSGNLTWASIDSSGVANGTSNVSIPTANGNVNLVANGNTTLVVTQLGANITGYANVTGNVSASYFIGNGSQLTGVSAASSSELANGTSNVTIPTANGPIIFAANGVANIMNVSDTGTVIQNILTVADGNITTESNSNLVLDPNGTGVVVIANTSGGATAIAMGSPTQGNLISNAVTLTTDSSVSNAIAQLNTVLGKLVPPAPPNFPASQSISVQTLSTYRMANYVQTDNTPGANKSVAGGTTVTSARRASSYTTGNITIAGPGDTGTITAFLNGSNAGSRTLTTALDGNGTYSNLVIFNNYDYNVANANIAAGFWSVFSSRVAGTVTEGWNEVYIADSATTNTNTTSWFYDSSAPGTPAFSSLTISAPVSPSYTYSSTVPHYNNTNQFTLTANVNKLSGNMYPTSDSFVTGTAGGAFAAPASVTYAAAGVTTPLAQNLYVSSGNASISTTSTIISGFGASSTGPSLASNNSYNSNTQAFTSTLAANVLYKTGTTSSASVIEEANVFVGSTIGSGSGLAFRIVNPGSGNTPAYTGSEAAFNSQSGTLQTYDSTVVANTLKHDQTNYSTGYLPVGPDLSSGRTGTQYFTIKIVRTSVSKFDIKWSGTIAGLWVALPGSAIDTSSTLNGWLDMSIAYAGAGQPGAGTGGNGSNGASLGGVAPLNSAQTNKSVTATFGTVSSSSTPDNEIYIRIALTSGQSVTALSLQTASN